MWRHQTSMPTLVMRERGLGAVVVTRSTKLGGASFFKDRDLGAPRRVPPAQHDLLRGGRLAMHGWIRRHGWCQEQRDFEGPGPLRLDATSVPKGQRSGEHYHESTGSQYSHERALD
eukprot:scaffold101656_cov63-Phaeocystis_antarctica.AAC.1